ncbi:outer membrane protein assembly factor BamC [Ramlibacter sp. MAHUQ-53]|uniref:outer membrane protein assembly factor BamC n=1 Tax=unclassified Ramlibacter TaxID=2617605 RepID=UPI003635DB60
MKHPARLALLALCAQLAACSSLQSDKIDYKSATTAPSLQVPPDLTQLARDTRYSVAGGAVTATAQQAARPLGVPTAVSSVADVRIERSGNQRWLVVKRPAEQIYPLVREFWQEGGFLLTQDQPELGIMETDWAENRAKIPQDFIRATIGKVLDSLYSTAERDRFRTRIERAADGSTEVYVTHRGLQEVTQGTHPQNTTGTLWQPRPADPELETEFLRRLMVKLGVPQQQAQATAPAAPARATARVATVNNQPVLQIDDAFDRAWRRVGLSLDRTGFTVEDRNRAEGTYFVRYVEPNPDRQQERGFFSRLFSGSEKPAAPARYRIAVRSQGEATTVSVLDANGAPVTTPAAQRIVQVLADDLK